MKRVIVDKNISPYSKCLLMNLGYEIIETVSVEIINNSTSTHPDMQFLKIADKTALVAEEVFSYYKNVLHDFKLFSVSGIKGKYPDDCVLNSVLFGKLFISTQKQFNLISSYVNTDPIIVNQGYTKCSTCVLSDNAIITGDDGIFKKCSDFNLKSYKLPDNEISLCGYKNGFWGGCSGLLDEKRLFFNGDIESLTCYNELIEILNKEKIEPIYHKHTQLTDNGSILSIDL